MVDPKKQDFGQKSIYSKEIIVFWGYGEHQFVKKLGMILDNKVDQKLKLEKKSFWSLDLLEAIQGIAFQC